MTIEAILALPDSVERTATLAAWLQGLYDTEPPILVGGSAVELYTGGAYRSGDLDFVGDVEPRVAEALTAAGFRRQGRHWVHEGAEVFLEFPARDLQIADEVVQVAVGDVTVRTISPEALLVDRLASWQHWKSAEDAVNGWLLYRAVPMRRERLAVLAAREGVESSLHSLLRVAKRWRRRDPDSEELAKWARQPPSV